jgi:hypothetical protein
MTHHSTDLSLVIRTPQLQIIASGPGRLLNQAYLKGGRAIEKKVNRLAYELGHGPDAVTERTLKGLRSQERALMPSAHLYSKVSGELERNCLKLSKYALPCVCLVLIMI